MCTRIMWKYVAAPLLAGAVFLARAGAALADAPAITSFTVSPSSISDGYSVTLVWSATTAYGNDLLFACPTGVSLKNADGGAVFPCNMRQAAPSANANSAGFVATNVSGGAKTVTVTVYPKNGGGADVDAGAMSNTFSVATAAQPLTSFTLSASTVASRGQITLSWSGTEIPGANIQFECTSGVSVYAGDPATSNALPCGAPAFAQDLGPSSSLAVTAVNTSDTASPVIVHIFPAIVSGMYDATHALSATFSVGGKPPPAVTSVSGFKVSPAQSPSESPMTLSWTTLNSSGATIEFSCVDSLSVFPGTSTTGKLPCGTSAFSDPLPSVGTTTVSVKNSSPYVQSISAILIPQDASGAYLRTSGRSVAFSVLPPAAPVQQTQAVTPYVPPPAKAPAAASPTGSAKRYVFTKSLSRGSQNADVKALQSLLASSPSLYPEGTVSGFYGPATERAVQRLQVKYSLSRKGDPAFGTVGPKTRALLNASTKL